jgi:hypothetical protein
MIYYRWTNYRGRQSIWHAAEAEATCCSRPFPAENARCSETQHRRPCGRICSICRERLPRQRQFSLRLAAAIAFALITASYAPSFPIAAAKEGREVYPPAPAPTLAEAAAETGPLPPEAKLEGPKSARLGEMVVMRAAQTANVSFCTWSIEPEPDSVETVDIVHRHGKQIEIEPGRELHWSSTTEGVYTITLSIAGPGGLITKKQRTAYGTQADDNTLAPAAQNMALAEDNGFDVQLLHQIRAVRSRNKDADRFALAGAFDQVAREIADTHITSLSEMAQRIRRLARDGLGANYSRWGLFLDAVANGVGDSIIAGELPPFDRGTAQYATLANEIADLLRDPP